jgi:polysaccharide export outer membrane protein
MMAKIPLVLLLALPACAGSLAGGRPSSPGTVQVAASQPAPPSTGIAPVGAHGNEPPVAILHPPLGVAPSGSGVGDPARLEQLFAERARDSAEVAYRVGAGDRLKISASGVPDLEREYSVATDGSINLPLLGSVQVAGKTSDEIAASLRDALAGEYLEAPEVIVSMTSYAGHRVAVLGGVVRPGMYELHSNQETILDVLTRAGGISMNASPMVYFTPAAKEAQDGAVRMAALGQVKFPQARASVGQPVPIEIDLDGLLRGEEIAALALPARGGDVIYVGQAGQIIVDGWVENPGPYRMESGLTVTQAISKAGGLHFASSPHSITVMRIDQDGRFTNSRYEYAVLASSFSGDVPLRTGDRVYVSVNPMKAAAWGVYKVMSTLFRVGIGGSIAVF